MRRTSMKLFYIIVASSLLAAPAANIAAQQTTPPPAGRGGRGGGGGRGTAFAPGDTSCPLGQTEIRPRSCMAPEFTPPSILDYRPRTTLVADAHMVKAS